MSIETYIVDSFTDQPFKGNPAGVCILNSVISDTLMLQIAQELGLSETAFVLKHDNQNYSIRFFSPKMEIPLCGHATLAAAKVLFQKNTEGDTIRFKNTHNLELIISNTNEEYVMNFPQYQTHPCVKPQNLINALKLKDVVDYCYNQETNIILLRIDSSKTLAKLKPNFNILKASHDSINGVLITTESLQVDYDFESRYFWPWSGTNEDPVTGATHTFLAPYWSKILGKTALRSFQCSERTGFMRVNLISDEKIEIIGQAQIIFRGSLSI